MLHGRNVLIFHLGALGDFLLTWPLALALSRLYPQSRIYYVTHGQHGALAERALRVDSADIEGGWHHLFSPQLAENALPDSSRILLGRAHGVFTFLSDGQDAWSQNVRRLAPHAELWPLKSPRQGELPPGTALLEGLAPAARAAVEQMLRSIAQRGLGLSRVPDSWVAIHPGAGSAAKRWPLQRFAELGRRFCAQGKVVRWLLGEVEREQFSAGQLEMLGKIGPIEQVGDGVQLLELLLRTGMLVCNDSGPGHLAGMLGVPTFVLFGPTEPERWKPLGPRVRTLRAARLDQLEAQEVWRWIEASGEAASATRPASGAAK